MVRIILKFVRQERHLFISDFRVSENNVPPKKPWFIMIFHIFPCFPSSNISRTATRDRELHVSAIVRSNQQPELQGLISWSHKTMGPSAGANQLRPSPSQKMSPMSRSYRFFGFRLGMTRVAQNSMLDHWQNWEVNHASEQFHRVPFLRQAWSCTGDQRFWCREVDPGIHGASRVGAANVL